MTADVGFAGLASSLVLVAVAVGLSVVQRLALEGVIVWAAVRAVGQLLVVGAALTLVVAPDAPRVYAWGWVVVMLLVAADVVRRRAPEIPRVGRLALAAFVASALVTLGVVFGLGILPATGRTIVPLAGMMVGNAMTATVLAARRVIGEIHDHADEVEARLALGHPGREASRPYLSAALRTALVPQIESTKAVGLVSLPGAMTGLILAGADPIDAVIVQAVVMFLVLGAVATTVTVVGLGARRLLVTPDHRLEALTRPRSA